MKYLKSILKISMAALPAIMLLSFAFLIQTGNLFAQETTALVETVSANPNALEGLKQILSSFLIEYFTTTAGFMIATTFVAGIVMQIKRLADLKNYWKQAITLGISLVLAGLGSWLSIGLFQDISIPAALVLGLQISLSANGAFAWVKNIQKDR